MYCLFKNPTWVAYLRTNNFTRFINNFRNNCTFALPHVYSSGVSLLCRDREVTDRELNTAHNLLYIHQFVAKDIFTSFMDNENKLHVCQWTKEEK